MDAKEKAEELVEKMMFHTTNEAIKCALIAVEELMNSTQPKSRMFRYNEYCIEYWQEVKETLTNKLK